MIINLLSIIYTYCIDSIINNGNSDDAIRLAHPYVSSLINHQPLVNFTYFL